MNYKKITAIFALLYIIAIAFFMLIHRMWFSPDQFFAFALLGTLLIGRAKIFLFDWLPFILSYLGYEFMRSVVPLINKNVHIFGMIKLDQFFFGFIPAVKFQSLFYNSSQLKWYDYLSAFVYISHFVTPMLVGFIFWLTDRKIFKAYAIAFLTLSYLGLFTFILFPAMPPWMASNLGYIPQTKQTLGEIMSHFPVTKVSFPTVYSFVGSDPVAAIPSLHAAFPLLIFFFLLKKFKFYGLLFLPYVLMVWFSVMYLGEHYFTDILVGTIYAVTVFVILNIYQKNKLSAALQAKTN